MKLTLQYEQTKSHINFLAEQFTANNWLYTYIHTYIWIRESLQRRNKRLWPSRPRTLRTVQPGADPACATTSPQNVNCPLSIPPEFGNWIDRLDIIRSTRYATCCTGSHAPLDFNFLPPAVQKSAISGRPDVRPLTNYELYMCCQSKTVSQNRISVPFGPTRYLQERFSPAPPIHHFCTSYLVPFECY